jgi:glycosyltransferase
MPPHPTLYIRREFYEKIGGFDTRYKISADYHSILQFFSMPNFNTVYLPEVLVKMRLGGVSNSTLGGIAKKSFEDWCALRDSGFSIINTSWALSLKNLSKLNQFFGMNK